MDRGSLVFALVALLVAVMPRDARAEEAISEAAAQMTPDANVDDDDDQPSAEGDALDEPADEQDDEALDEPADGLDELEMAGRTHKKHRAKPVELSRRRTPIVPKHFFLAPMGHGLFCVVDLDEHPEIKDRSWGQSVDVGDCKAVLVTTTSLLFGAGGALAGLPGGPALSIIMGAEGGLAGAMLGLGLSYYICRGLPKEIESPHDKDPWTPSYERPISSVIPRPGDIGCGLPCVCPDFGCGCDSGCGCGCGCGASCGCDTGGGGV